MALPTAIGLPEECRLGDLNYSLAPEARSYNVKVQPSNLSQVQATGQTFTASTISEWQFPVQNLIFDIPCGASPSTFLDTRQTVLNGRINITCTTASTGLNLNAATTRGSLASFFDRMYITAQNGNIIEDITEYGLNYDTFVNLQMNKSSRSGNALLYGFNADTAIEDDGLVWNGLLSANTTQLGTTYNESYGFSIPVVSGVIGVLNDKFVNVGRTSRLQAVFQTAPIVPITFDVSGATTGTYTITLTDLTLEMTMVDIGISSLRLLDQTLHEGKAYSHGTSLRTATATLGTSAGQQTLLAGLRASSIKSLFARFYDTGTSNATNSANGKYDSKNPLFNSLNFNIGGTRFPQIPVNPLLNPQQAFNETQKAVGSFNSSQYQSSIVPKQYCKLSANATLDNGLAVGGTQNYYWSKGSSSTKQSQFIFGVNTEVVAKRGIMSGVNATSAPIFLEGSVATNLTNSHNVYMTALIDHILIHDITNGDIQVRL